MIRSIVVTGSECTGKTTLATRLAETLKLPYVPEYARLYAMDKLPRALGYEDVCPIAVGQRDAQIRGLAAARDQGAKAVVMDTDLLSTWTYSFLYYGRVPEALTRWGLQHRGALYVLCSHAGVPWQSDGIRDRPSDRAENHAAFVRALLLFQCQVVSVSGDLGQRLDHALEAVQDRSLTAAR